MIAVAKPKLSSKENRARIKAERRKGLESRRKINREFAESQVQPSSALASKPGPSARSLKQADGARLARERWARKKAERLARRPRPVQAEKVARKPVPAPLAVVPGVVSQLVEAGS